MLPTSSAALVIILLAIVPGYIAATTWARARTWRGPSGDLRTILQSLSLSAGVQVILSPLTISWILPVRTKLSTFPERVAIWSFLAVLVLPIILGLVGSRLTDVLFDPLTNEVSGRFKEWVYRWTKGAATPPTMWDWFFDANPPAPGSFLIVEFKDGAQVAGVYAAGSTSLTSPEPHGLFLEVEWEIDEMGNVANELPGSRGIMIPRADDVRSIRILGSRGE